MNRKNKILLAVFAVAFCAFGARAEVFNPETITLKNGMQVVVVTNRRAPVVTQMWWLKAGGMDDAMGKSGAAHFLEHLLFRGTKNTDDGEYSRIISHLGGDQNAMTSLDYTAYYATVGREHLEKIMVLEADRIAHWQITDAQIATERDVVLKEREQRTEDDPVSAFFEEVNEVLYKGHAYARPVIGFRREIEQLDRVAAEEFFNTHYAPNNIVMVLSGDVNMAEVKPLLERYYAPIPPRQIALRVQGEASVAKSAILKKSSPLVKQTIWSSHVLFNPARPETIAEADALTVLVKILGDGRTGRLYRRLVVKEGLASSASISFDPVSVGFPRLTVAVSPSPKADLQKIEDIVKEEMSVQNITATELENARKSLQISAIYARDSVTGPAFALGEALVSGLDIPTVERYPERIGAVTLENLAFVAKTLSAKYENALIAILTPEEKK
jgi:zinc protease